MLKFPLASVVVSPLTLDPVPPVGVATIWTGTAAVGGVTKPETRTVTVAVLVVPLVRVTEQGSFKEVPLVPA
jgi:hypothetical protein